MARAKAKPRTKMKKSVKKKSVSSASKRVDMDPVTLAVLSKRFESITTKMANTLLRTGRSGVLNLAKDFSTSIVDWCRDAADSRFEWCGHHGAGNDGSSS